MTTFCKTSQGGINLDHVSDWDTLPAKEGGVYLYVHLVNQESTHTFKGKEATRLLAILNGVCLFDTTQERAK